MSMEENRPITIGIRDIRFKEFIISLLSKGRIKSKYIDQLLDKESMDLYAKAFTNPTADAIVNYEILEKIGDSTCNKSIMWYIFRKFPKLESKPQGLMIFSRLFHTLQSTQTFSQIALNLGFEKFISYGWMKIKEDKYEDVMKVKRNGVLEDCFEAFFGATELIIDRKIREGVGYAICNEIFKGMITDIQFPSIKYEDLFDPITRLKELFDYNFNGRGKLGKYSYVNCEEDRESLMSNIKKVYIDYTNIHGQTTRIATGQGSLKEKAKASAAIIALSHFKRLGYERPIPYDYRDFI